MVYVIVQIEIMTGYMFLIVLLFYHYLNNKQGASLPNAKLTAD